MGLLAASLALLWTAHAAGLAIPQLRLRRIRAIIVHRGEVELLVVGCEADPGFRLGETQQVTWLVPVPASARGARIVHHDIFAAVDEMVDRLRIQHLPPRVTQPPPWIPSFDVEVLTGSPGAVDAMVQGGLRSTGSASPDAGGMAFYRNAGWTYVLARARLSGPPPVSLSPIAVVFRSPQPVLPIKLLSHQAPVAVDVTLISEQQPVLDREALRARGLEAVELMDAPPASPGDQPLALPFSQIPASTLPAELRTLVSQFGAVMQGLGFTDLDLAHVASIQGQSLDDIESWTDDLVLNVREGPPPGTGTPTVGPGAAGSAGAPTHEIPTGPPPGAGCLCRAAGAPGSGGRLECALLVFPLALAGVRRRRRGRRFSRDPRAGVNGR